jgi:hypothetical protein
MTDFIGKIYIIRSHKTDDVYIGSTTLTLEQRFTNHKTSNETKANDIIQYDDAFIEMLEECICETKEQLYRKEGDWIQKTKNCINKNLAGRTAKEWRQSEKGIESRKKAEKVYSQTEYGKEQIQQKNKRYLSKPENKEKYQEYKQTWNKTTFDCSCGKTITNANKTKHLKTKYHENAEKKGDLILS